MNIKDAAYHTAHDHPGGVPALAVRMGMSANVLQNKVNPSQDYHKLSLDEALRMQTLTGDVRVLHAMAGELNHVAIPLADYSGASDSDGVVTKKELSELDARSYDLMQRHMALMQRLRGMAT